MPPYYRSKPLGSAALMLITIGSSCGVAPATKTTQNSCPWAVTRWRPATLGDAAFEDRDPLLKDPENPNRVKGPNDLVAIVKSDSLHHPHIYIENVKSGERRHLIRGSKPRWSPDGSRIACEVWKSLGRPWMLCVIDVKSGKALEPEIGCLVDTYRWSPDGRSIAVGGTLYGRSVNVLCWVRLPTGESRMLDTLTVFAAYEDLAWSPDSRVLVVTRVTAVDAEEEATAADLWIFDGEGHRCPLTKTDNLIEEEPRWINNSDILITQRPSASGAHEPSERRVITVTRASSDGR